MVKAVIFDFYGVLHTDTLWGLANLYIPERTPEQERRIVDLAKASNLGYIDRGEFWSTSADIYERTLEEVEDARDEMGVLDPGLLVVIGKLRAKGLKTAIISNVGKGFLEKKLTPDQMRNYFDAVIESGGVGFIKPDSRIFEYACQQLGVAAEECLFFDDAERNVVGAQAAGMQAELYTGLPVCKATLERLGVLSYSGLE